VNARDFYLARAKSLIKDAREEKGVSYLELTQRLKPLGVTIKEQVLINRINRGTYSFTFALRVLAALGVNTIKVPKLPTNK